MLLRWDEQHPPAMTNHTALQSGLSTRCPKQAAGIVEYEIEDEVVLYDPRSDAVHTLSPTAAVVWWLCDGDRGVDDISRELGDLYELRPQQVRRDVGAVMRQFRASRLITWP